MRREKEIRKKKKKKNTIYNFLILVFLIVFIFSAYKVGEPYIKAYFSQKETAELKQLKVDDEKAFYKKNSDAIGWISIPDTKIDYPVMYTPDDPEYYLRRNFDKEWEISGTPFVGEGCQPGSDNLIIYGHHMKSGIMFADLGKYEDPSFYQEHKYVDFETKSQLEKYVVVAAFKTKIPGKNENSIFKYYNYGGNFTDQSFEEFKNGVNNIKLYDTGEDMQRHDKFLTLSTCFYHTENGRFVVVAKLIDRQAK